MEGSTNNAISQAALIVIQKIQLFFKVDANDHKKLEEIIEPLFGVRWSKEIIVRVGSKAINDFLTFVKRSTLGKLR